MFEMVTGQLPFTGDSPLVAAAKRLKEPPPRPEATTPGLDAKWSATILRCLAREPEQRFKSALEILAELERPSGSWSRWAGVGLVGLALGLAVIAGVKLLPSLRKAEPPRAAIPAAPRPALTILGFRDELASPELAWLPTAVSETLGHELAAAETSLRVIPGDRVAQVRRSLGLSDDAVTEGEARVRMQGMLAANVFVYGTLKPMAQGSASVWLSVTMVDASSGRELASFEEDLGEGASALTEKLSSVAARLRQTLGVSLSQEEAAALAASRARNLSATKSYTQGVMHLRKFDYGTARGYFEAAFATDSNFLDAQRRVVETWEHEGNRKKARDAAERIRSKQTSLTPRQLAELDAKLLSLGPEPGKGKEARKALFDATPDDVELGLSLVDEEVELAPKTASAVVSRLRELPLPTSADPRLDRADAAAAWRLGDGRRAKNLLSSTKARARVLGSRTELAAALAEEAAMHWQGEEHAAEAVGPFQEAAGLLAEVGELDKLAQVQLSRAVLMMELFPLSTSLKTLEETAALYRKLGDRAGLASVLILSAFQLTCYGNLELATRRLAEALAESQAIRETNVVHESPGGSYTWVQGVMALFQADLEGVWNAIRLIRSEPNQNEGCADCLESDVLYQQDRLQEARETLEKVMASEAASGGRLPAFGSQIRLCGLACDLGHPLEGLACFAQHPPPAGIGPMWTLETGASLAHCRYLAGDIDGAERAAIEGRAVAHRLEWYNYRVLANAYLMRARAARGESAQAIASLRADLAEAEGKEKQMAFEVALALGEVERRAGRPEGRPRLLKLEQEAKSKGFFRIARLAREALNGKPAAPTPAK